MNREQIWLESIVKMHSGHQYGMSSALGATKDKLPVSDSIPAGSTAFDYTTKKVYFFDGVSWNW